jgi:hypothetical protein
MVMTCHHCGNEQYNTRGTYVQKAGRAVFFCRKRRCQKVARRQPRESLASILEVLVLGPGVAATLLITYGALELLSWGRARLGLSA